MSDPKKYGDDRKDQPEATLVVKAKVIDNALMMRKAGDATATLPDGTGLEISQLGGVTMVHICAPDKSWRDYVISPNQLAEAVLVAEGAPEKAPKFTLVSGPFDEYPGDGLRMVLLGTPNTQRHLNEARSGGGPTTELLGLLGLKDLQAGDEVEVTAKLVSRTVTRQEPT